MAALSAEEIRARLAQMEAEHGPWTMHSIDLGEGVLTRPETIDPARWPRLADGIGDLLPGQRLRVLDLGALEGLYTIELAKRQHQVLAIEGREHSAAKIRFAAEVLGLREVEVLTQDVRELSPQRHGHFDLVLNCGVLYHLGAEDALGLLRQCRACLRPGGWLLLDSEVALEGLQAMTLEGQEYRGRKQEEPALSVQEQHPWAGIGNEESFWFDPPSLLALLDRLGFSRVYDQLQPSRGRPDRIWWWCR